MALMSSVMNTRTGVAVRRGGADHERRSYCRRTSTSGHRFHGDGGDDPVRTLGRQNVGSNCVESIIAAREGRSFGTSTASASGWTYKRTLEALVKCSFDWTGASRAAMVGVTKAVELAQKASREANADQFCMFDAAEIAPDKPIISDAEDDRRGVLEWEEKRSPQPRLGPLAAPRRPQAQSTPTPHRLRPRPLQDGRSLMVRRSSRRACGTTRRVRATYWRCSSSTYAKGLAGSHGLRGSSPSAPTVREVAILKVRGIGLEGIPRVVALELEERISDGLLPLRRKVWRALAEGRGKPSRSSAGTPAEAALSGMGGGGSRSQATAPTSAELKQILKERCISTIRRVPTRHEAPEDAAMEQVGGDNCGSFWPAGAVRMRSRLHRRLRITG